MPFSENIRTQRKRRGLTQEQLAEAMNVSTAAVSKWETGLSVPDISMVLLLADYFEISVDALLGYTARSRRRDDMLAEAEDCVVRHEYDRAISLTEDALRRYPNDFDVVLAAARCRLFVQEEAHQRRALDLLERAMALFPQQEKPKARWDDLLYQKGLCLNALHDHKGAIACFKDSNLRGMNNQLIADCCAQMGEYETALSLFSAALVDSLSRVINSAAGMAECLMQDRPEEAVPLVRWCIGMLDGLATESGGFVWKVYTLLYTVLALSLAEAGQESEARAALHEAAAWAARFDAAPDYSMAGWRFFYGDSAKHYSSDTLGETAAQTIRNLLHLPSVKPGTREQLLSWLDEV